MTFPDDWPRDCPPTDALDASGRVYRRVKTDPPGAGDFATHRETGKLPRAPECLRCGLSVFRDLVEVDHQRRLFPRLGQFIAQADLEAGDGKTRLTTGQQPSHTTWWAYQEADRASLFIIV